MTFRCTINRGLAALTCLTCLLLSMAAKSQTNASPAILLLKVKLHSDQSVQVIGYTNQPGVIKSTVHTDSRDGIHYELLDKAGISLWRGATSDLRGCVIKSQAPLNSNGLAAAPSPPTETELLVRVPACTGAVRLQFFRWIQTPTNQLPVKLFLGGISVPAP